MTKAKTKKEFAEAWASQLGTMWGIYPLDYDKFKGLMLDMEFEVALKADSLDLPEGEGWQEYLLEITEAVS